MFRMLGVKWGLTTSLFLLSPHFVADFSCIMSCTFRRASAVTPKHRQPTGLIPLADVPAQRKTYGGLGQLRPTHYGRVYTPDGIYSQSLHNPQQTQDGILQGNDEGTVADPGGEIIAEVDEKRVAKNQRLWRKWSEDTIPMLIQPYMKLVQRTSSLRHRDISFTEGACTGCSTGRLLSVSCVFFESTSQFPFTTM